MQTPLHAAAWNARPELAALLVRHGADTEAMDQYNDTPLLIAIHESRLEVVEALLDGGADPNAEVYGGSTPCIRARSNEAFNESHLLERLCQG